MIKLKKGPEPKILIDNAKNGLKNIVNAWITMKNLVVQ